MTPNQTNPPKKQVDDFVSYDFIEVWGGTREESNAKVMSFFESSHFQVGPFVIG